MNKHIITSTFLFVFLFFISCNKKPVEKESPVTFYDWKELVVGADMSFVNELEAAGAVYKSEGKQQDPFAIIKSIGVNTVRVRLWHNPVWKLPYTGGKLYSGLADAEKTIRRAKEQGMAVCLDLHYSDTWADPGNQSTPAAWSNLTFDLLKDSVYQYTTTVLNYLKAKQLVPEMIQIGNENNGGILWPHGKIQANTGWDAFAALLNSGIKAVRDFSVNSNIKPLVLIHVAQLQNVEYWLDALQQNGLAEIDLIGVSHYYPWSTLNNMQTMGNKIDALQKKYRKKIMIVETAVPWTNGYADSYNNILPAVQKINDVYEVSPAGMQQYLNDMLLQIQSKGGGGVMYWEPAWISSPAQDPWGTGSPWENATWFDFTGNLHKELSFQKK